MCDKNAPGTRTWLVGDVAIGTTLHALHYEPSFHSQWDVPVLLGRIAIAFSSQHPERLDQPGPGVAGIDDVIDVASGRRSVGMSELFGVLLDQLLGGAGRVLGAGNLVLEQDLHRALGSQDRDLCRRPGKVHIAPYMLRAHD